MNYTADNIEKLRQDGKLQTYIQSERGVIATLNMSSVVEHHGNPFGSVLVHVGTLTGQCWIEPYKGEGGSVCIRCVDREIESWSLAGFETPQQALEKAKLHLINAMQKYRLDALAQAQVRLDTLQAAAA